MKDALNAPYGGTLVQRVVPRGSVRTEGLPTLVVGAIVESDLFNLATGAFSPLDGFMNARTLETVFASSRLSDGGLPWTIPIVFDVTDDQKLAIGGAPLVLLKSEATGKIVGTIKPEEVFPHDKERRIAATYGTSEERHPGVKLVRGMGAHLLAGKVSVFEDALSADPLSSPSGVRARLEKMGLTKVAGFQTRNVVHRAHEHQQRVALEVCGGLLVHPVIGWKKPGDFRPEAVRAGYEAFIRAFFPQDRVLLAFLNLAMRYAGPKEAVLHAIVRKNYGCSHFVVGRDHAGVGGFYGTYAAHEIFETLPGLGIEILRLREPFFCAKCEGIATDRSCGHAESDRERISGTKVRGILGGGVDPGHHIFRTEVLRSLDKLKKDGLFYE